MYYLGNRVVPDEQPDGSLVFAIYSEETADDGQKTHMLLARLEATPIEVENVWRFDASVDVDQLSVTVRD